MKYLFIVLILLSSCKTTLYYKDGATVMDFNKDKTNCLVKAYQAGYNDNSWGDSMQKNRFFKDCMNGEGWVLK